MKEIPELLDLVMPHQNGLAFVKICARCVELVRNVGIIGRGLSAMAGLSVAAVRHATRFILHGQFRACPNALS